MVLARIDTILQQIQRSGFIKPLLIGVSGGPDSLCLLDICHRSGYAIIVAHFNHGLRQEADGEAAFVEQTARAMEVKFVSAKENVAEYAHSNKLSIEEAARFQRYTFLFTQARLHGAAGVAVAHTADDQVETVLMHLLRGSGLSGLKGMAFISQPNPWSQDIPLVRPLLSCWRTEIDQYCRDHGLHPVQDSSNQDSRYYRNRLRHELIPMLETYNPQARKILWNTALTLSGDEEIVGEVVRSVWDGCLLEQGPGYLAFQRKGLLRLRQGVQRRLVRESLERLHPGLRDIDFETIERAKEYIISPPKTASVDLTAGIYLMFEAERIWIVAKGAILPVFNWPQMLTGVELSLDVPGEVCLAHGWRLKVEMAGIDALPAGYVENDDPFQAWLSVEHLEMPLKVRTRRRGDRFQPLGMEMGSVKLSDLMINSRLPRRARSAWPLVCSKDAIVWVPGRRISHPARVVASTRHVVHLQLLRTGQEINPNKPK